MSGLFVGDVAVGGQCVHVRIADGRIAAMGPEVRSLPGGDVIGGRGGALLPGLHDHHLHLLAMAAARHSVKVGPPEVSTPADFARALQQAHRTQPPGDWIRAVGYHESVAGELDRHQLDLVVADRPVRVQHRSGAMWVLNSAAATAVGLELPHAGRLFRMDGWLRDRMPPADVDLAAVGRQLAGYGITGVTDATPFDDIDGFDTLAAAALPLDVVVTGGPGLTDAVVPERLRRGPVKIVIPDHDPMLLPFDDLAAAIAAAHAANRNVAVHCVTREALALLLAAFDASGAQAGDRVEHGAVVPPDLAKQLAGFGVTVVTQPAFIRERGDRYLADVEPDDRPWLYPCRSLLAAGVLVGGSSDAPFGAADPWAAIETATSRRTREGQTVGRGEALTAERALALYLSEADDPGGRPRRIQVGGTADLCLLDRPLADALRHPSADHVVATIRAGRVTYARADQ